MLNSWIYINDSLCPSSHLLTSTTLINMSQNRQLPIFRVRLRARVMSHVTRYDRGTRMTFDRSTDVRWGERRETGDGGGIEKAPSCRITHPQTQRTSKYRASLSGPPRSTVCSWSGVLASSDRLSVRREISWIKFSHFDSRTAWQILFLNLI